jgi:hypothetical protein
MKEVKKALSIVMVKEKQQKLALKALTRAKQWF